MKLQTVRSWELQIKNIINLEIDNKYDFKLVKLAMHHILHGCMIFIVEQESR